MGFDILCFPERFETGKWVFAGEMVENPAFDPDAPDSEPRLEPQPIYDNRNYALFAILADVRNPVRALKPFIVISEPRGLPEDVSRELRICYDYFDEDAFNASWLLASELFEFDWDGHVIERRGVVNPAVADLFEREKPFPHEKWPTDIPKWVAESGVGAEVFWTDTYRQAVGDHFFSSVLSPLRQMGNPDQLRLVFWFLL